MLVMMDSLTSTIGFMIDQPDEENEKSFDASNDLDTVIPQLVTDLK